MESQSDFSGARRIPLVGQRPFLRVLETRVHNTGLNLFYLEGAGGIGKTFLLMTALEEWSVNEFCTARTIVDLYHLDAQSPEGFVRRVLDSFDQVLFPGTRTLLGKLDEARQEGNDRQVQEHLRELDNCFVNDINLLSATRPVILALDTLEVLVYTDEEQVQATVLDIGNWLLHDFLPKIQGNVIVLMAGRPSVWNQQLDSLIQQHPHIQTETFTVSALSEAESKEYLETIIAKYADPDATARLQAFSEEHSAALPLLTQGKPILLSLVADMVAQGSVLPLVFAEPLEKLRSLEPEKLQEIVRHALFDCLQASPSPVGETLRQLAWLRKGATPELLARLLRLKTPQGDWDITKATQYLDKVRILTFVKARSDDDRTFLHDELYALFDCYAPPYRSSEEQASVYGVIETYYDAQLGFLPSAQEMLPQVEAQRQQLHLERLHYLLRKQPEEGYLEYFSLIESATTERNQGFEMLLRSELVRTAALPEMSRFPSIKDFRKQIQVDLLIRRGVHALFLCDPRNFELALKCLDQALTETIELEFNKYHALVYKAVVYILRGHGEDYRIARSILEHLVSDSGNNVSEMSMKSKNGRLLGVLIYNYLGYLDRREGRYQEAIKHYQVAVYLQRVFKLSSLAPILINLAYVQAYMGLLHEASLSLDEAEQWVKETRSRSVLVRLLNTQAYVEMRCNNHGKALRFTERALEHKDSIDSMLLGQIYYTQALIYKSKWDVDDETSKKERARSQNTDSLVTIIDAAQQIEKALHVFPENSVEYQDALTEKAKIYRNVGREWQWREQDAECKKALQISNSAIERALHLAQDALKSIYPQVRALNAKAWSHYFMGEDDSAWETADRVYNLIPPEYLLKDNLKPGTKVMNQPYVPFWEILARIEMVQCHLALNQAQKCGQTEEFDQNLQKAVQYATRALTYNALIADKYPDVERAETGLYKRILREGFPFDKLHFYAHEYAQRAGVESTRLQEFLTRLFGPAELWL